MFGGWLDLIVIVLMTLAAATTGSIFKPGPFYDTLEKPSWNPPDWLFPIAWTILYIMIAAAGWLVWREVGLSVVMVIWAAQLVFNALWSYLAFGRQRFDWAFYELTFSGSRRPCSRSCPGRSARPRRRSSCPISPGSHSPVC